MLPSRAAVLLTVLILATGLWGQTPPDPSQATHTVVFADTTVIPMDAGRVLEHTTVVVEAGKITQLGPANTVKIPAGARVIDGRGKFLIPGLADMHSHIDRKEMLPLFLAAGVTTTLNMGLASPQFVTRRATSWSREARWARGSLPPL